MISFLKKIIVSLIYLSSFLISTLNAQNKTIDSLLTALKTKKQDSNYVKNLIRISNLHIQNSKYTEAKNFAQQALNASELINYKIGVIKSNITFSRLYIQSVNFDSSIFINYKLLKIIDTINDKYFLANIYHDLGEANFRKGNYNSSVSYFIKALKTTEMIKDKDGMISCLLGIAANYKVQKNNKAALKNYFEAEKLALEIGNEKKLASIYNSIGILYADVKEKALFYFLKSLALKEKLGNKQSIAVSLGNIAEIYSEQKKYKEALNTFKKVLAIGEEIGNKHSLCNANIGIGLVYQRLDNFTESEKYYKKSLKFATEIGTKDLIDGIYVQLSNLYEKKGDFKQALLYQKLYTSLKDTLYNTESSKQINEMNTKYETEKKDKELIKKDAEISLQQVQTEKQAVIKNGFIIGFVFLLGLITFIYRGYTQKQKTNLLLNDKNQKITDSINYAKIIQSSILPSLDEMKKHLPESFVFYQPKDIVSGDFYWLYPINENVTIFAVIDCTGHGVPGALMSMLGYSLLEQIINQDKMHNPADILNKLNYLVIESLKQSENGDTVKNGMDMVIFKLDYNTYELEFAGAKNPLYVIRDQNLIELKGDRKSIGLSSGNTTPFTNHQLKLFSGDSLYAFSDGYIDQKGGTENKKFYSSTFQKLLININMLNANEQHEQVKAAFTNWKGSKEQMDDVLVFGVKV